MPQKFSPVDIMRQWLYIREANPNKGRCVESLQHWGGGQPGDSYCCESWYAANDIAYQGTFAMQPTQACQTVYAYAKAHGLLVAAPQPGDTFLYVDDNDHAHHIGFVTVANPLTGIAGNTSADGKSSNGDGFHEHALVSDPRHVKFVRFPK